MNRRAFLRMMAMIAAAMPLHSLGGSMKKQIPAKPTMSAILKGVGTIHCTGDSLTDGSSYPDYVVNTINTVFGSSISMQNSGIGGNTVPMLRERLQADVLDRKPDLVSICLGTNDCLQNVSLVDFKAGLEQVVDTLCSANIKVLLIQTSHLVNAESDRRLLEYCQIVKQIAEVRRLPCANAHELFLAWEKQGKKMICPDGVHHDPDGFIGMARVILDTLGLTGCEINLKIKPAAQTLTVWEVSAPLETAQAYRAPLNPALAIDWKPFDRVVVHEMLSWWEQQVLMRGAFMPMVQFRPTQNLMAFGRSIYSSSETRSAQLLLGGTHPQQVWLNGKKVFERVRFHGIHPDADRVAVTLVAGANEIIVATEAISFVGILA